MLWRPFSDALRRGVLLYGIDVIVIEPGTVWTLVVRKFDQQNVRFSDTDYAPMLQRVRQTVAERVVSALPVDAVSAVGGIHVSGPVAPLGNASLAKL